MRLISLTIGGFKNLALTKIEPKRPVISIVSPNNYGKSNLLEGLQFAVDFMSAGAKMRDSMMAWENGVPITPELENEPFHFEVELEAPELEEYGRIRYGFTFQWARDNDGGRQITGEWLDMRGGESAKYARYLERQKSQYRRGKSTKSFRHLVLEKNTLAIDILPSVDDLEYGGALKALKRFGYRVCHTLDVNQRFKVMPIALSEEDSRGILFDDEDIPRALHGLQSLYPERYLYFEDAVHALFPEFDEISIQTLKLSAKANLAEAYVIRTNDENREELFNDIPFHIKDKIYRVIIRSKHLNQPVSLERMSSGTKRIIWLLANVFIADCAGVHCIGVEELETSIHPKMLKELLEVISQTLTNTCLIISSHSPYFIQYVSLDQIYVGDSCGSGVARFLPIRKSKQGRLLSAARSYDLSVGEYLFELMSREEDGAKILRTYLEGETRGE